MQRRALIFTVVFMLFCAVCPHARADSCPPAPRQPQISINLNVGDVRYDNTRNIVQMIDLYNQNSNTDAAGAGHVPLGLTHSSLRYSYNMDAILQPLRDGTYCAYANNVAVDITMPDQIVYVAIDLPRDSCIYREVLVHENRHVQLNNEIAYNWRQRMQYRVEAIVASIGTVRANSQQQATDIMQSQIKPQLNNLIQEMLDDRKQQQAQIDTPYEYDRVSRSCRGEVQKYIPDSLRH